MSFIPYRVHVKYAAKQSANKNDSKFVIDIPSFLSTSSYFELRLVHAGLSNTSYTALDENASVYLSIEYQMNNIEILQLVYDEKAVGEVYKVENNEVPKLFNLSAFIKGGCPDNRNFRIVLPYKSSYTFKVVDIVEKPYTNIFADLVFELNKLHF